MSGRICYSVTFAWKFSGVDDTVTRGLANEVGTRIEKKLVSLNGRDVDVLATGLVPKAYKGRVNGNRTADSSPSQASSSILGSNLTAFGGFPLDSLAKSGFP